MINEHMKMKNKLKNTEIKPIGDNDGTFWISLTDLFLNFETIFLCRWFSSKWEEHVFHGEWSESEETAGGSSNDETFEENP